MKTELKKSFTKDFVLDFLENIRQDTYLTQYDTGEGMLFAYTKSVHKLATIEEKINKFIEENE